MALRDHIKENHDTAEKHPFVKLLFSGGVSPQIYADYLVNQYLMYVKLEQLLENNALLVGVESVKRHQLMFEDLMELNLPCKIFNTTLKYNKYLETVPVEELMAHMYVRHFGDLFGGQLMKKVVPGSGAMYEFKDRSKLIAELRSRLDDGLAEEANRVMLFAIDLFEDIANEHDIRDT